MGKSKQELMAISEENTMEIYKVCGKQELCLNKGKQRPI